MEPVKLKSFYDLLDEGCTPAQLATAVEKHGVIGWDRYGRYGNFKPSSEAAKTALDALADHYCRQEMRTANEYKGGYGPLDAYPELGGTVLDFFGWEEGKVPQFDDVSKHPPAPKKHNVSEPRESTLLNVIGALLSLITASSLKRGKSQSEVIRNLTERHPRAPGISKSNLEKLLPAALESLKESTPAQEKSP